MVCLQCGHRQPEPDRPSCASCQAPFRKVEGVFGVNNFTQVLQALEDYRNGIIDQEKFRDTFDAFYDLWDRFAERWKIEEGRLLSMFALSPGLRAVYERPLQELESGLEELTAAAEIVDALEDAQEKELEALSDHLLFFFRKICSASGAVFTKLESRGGDFSALMSAFGLGD